MKKDACEARWQQLLEQSHLADEPDRQISTERLDALNRRIMTAVRTDTATPVRDSRPFWRRPAVWGQAAGALAAVLLLVVSLPLLQSTMNRDKLETSGFWANLRQTSEQNERSLLQDMAAKSAAETAVWQPYSGSLAEIPSLACFFAARQTANGTDYIATPTDKGQIPEAVTSGDSTDGRIGLADPIDDFFVANNVSLSVAGRSLIDALNDATTLRVLTDATAGRTLLLVAYRSETAEHNLAPLRQAFEACQTPVRIEIIRQDDLNAELERLEPGLVNRLLGQESASDQTWILILIGA
jgi:hypothetical protein